MSVKQNYAVLILLQQQMNPVPDEGKEEGGT
jgi:hypothetical protein